MEKEEKEGMKEKVKEIRIVPNDLNDTPLSRSPTIPAPTSPKPTAASFPGDVAPTPLQTDGKKGVRGVRSEEKEVRTLNDNTSPRTPLSFDWAEDVDATVAPHSHRPRRTCCSHTTRFFGSSSKHTESLGQYQSPPSSFSTMHTESFLFV